MARVLTGLVPTTELEALNALLRTVGESPVLQAELEAPSRPDTEMAVAILMDTMRATLLEGWKFNMEFGFELEPDDTYDWTGSNGDTATLQIFEKPSDLLEFVLTPTPRQQDLDCILRAPRDYSAAEGVLVFYDRARNRDGFESSDLTDGNLYINGTFIVDFEDSPEVFRQYVQAVASGWFQARRMGSQTLSQYDLRAIAVARRALRQEQGQEDAYNVFNNMDTLKMLGTHRRIFRGYRPDYRNSPRP
jgi:hypothetical protein